MILALRKGREIFSLNLRKDEKFLGLGKKGGALWGEGLS